MAVEFIVAFPAVMLFLLGVFQIMHGQVARLLVSQASHRAARAASLWMTECEIGTFEGAESARCVGGDADVPPDADDPNRTDEVEDRIRAAAALSLAPLTPPLGNHSPRNSAGDPVDHVLSLAGLGARADLGEWRRHERWSANLAFDDDVRLDERGVSKLVTAYDTTRVMVYRFDEETGRAQVVVEHAYYCGFPLASYFYCQSFAELPAHWREHLDNRGLSAAGRYRIIRAPASHAMAPLPED